MINSKADDREDVETIAQLTAQPGARAEQLRLKYSRSLDQRVLAIQTITRHERFFWAINEWARSRLTTLDNAKDTNEDD